jgi:hypothetical protein
MRYVAASLLSVVSSIAQAASYDVDGICRSLPQTQPLKSLCTEPLLTSSRQLERSYWSALGNVATPEGYRELHLERETWQDNIDVCSKKSRNTDEMEECLSNAIQHFGGVLESRFSDEDEDTLEMDALMESAQKRLNALDRAMRQEVAMCRNEAAAKPENRKRAPKAAARFISQSCHDPAYRSIAFSMSVQDESALYLLKAASQGPTAIEMATEQRYGLQSTLSFVLDERASRNAR